MNTCCRVELFRPAQTAGHFVLDNLMGRNLLAPPPAGATDLKVSCGLTVEPKKGPTTRDGCRPTGRSHDSVGICGGQVDRDINGLAAAAVERDHDPQPHRNRVDPG